MFDDKAIANLSNSVNMVYLKAESFSLKDSSFLAFQACIWRESALTIQFILIFDIVYNSVILVHDDVSALHGLSHSVLLHQSSP